MKLTKLRLLPFFLSFSICLASAMAEKSYIIPHFAAAELPERSVPLTSADLINTAILVVNPSSQEVSVTIEAFDDGGDRVLSVIGPESVPPRGLRRFTLNSQPSVSGWLKISTGAEAIVRGSIRLVRVFLLGVPPTGADAMRFTETDADPVAALNRASVPVYFGFAGDSTGVAIVFPSSDGASPLAVSMTLRAADGESLGSAEVQIAPNGRSAFLIHELFPQIMQAREAILDISAESPIFATTIRYQAAPIVWRTVELSPAP